MLCQVTVPRFVLLRSEDLAGLEPMYLCEVDPFDVVGQVLRCNLWNHCRIEWQRLERVDLNVAAEVPDDSFLNTVLGTNLRLCVLDPDEQLGKRLLIEYVVISPAVVPCYETDESGDSVVAVAFAPPLSLEELDDGGTTFPKFKSFSSPFCFRKIGNTFCISGTKSR